MVKEMTSFAPGTVSLQSGPFKARFELNKHYVMSLTNSNLLRNFYLEAGLWSYSGNGGTTAASTTSMDGPETWHWGWESPTCELRGHIMGHWLSAAARIYAQTGDILVQAKAGHIVAELARCQEENGSGWLAAFPETYMHRIARGKYVWAPHYTVHKLLMGLGEMYSIAGNVQALEIMKGIAAWFHQWTDSFSREAMDELLDLETGGMLEAWAELYAFTGDGQHLELVRRYDRRRFFDALLEGKDVLTNKHANTQIPEILGAARAYEVTGEERYRRIVEAFWKCAVTGRGYLCSGAVDDGELWMPGGEMASRLGVGQEHCVNYNMMRLAHTLLRWTGEAEYGDYWERRFYNGVLAHQHGENGRIAYFLGLGAGSRKTWGSETGHFWCCHGTLMQANASYEPMIFMEEEEGVALCQWIPSALQFKRNGAALGLMLEQDGQQGAYPMNGWSVTGMNSITKVNIPPVPVHRPDAMVYKLTVTAEKAAQFSLRLRMPWWIKEGTSVKVNGELQSAACMPSAFYELDRFWSSGDIVEIELRKGLTAEPLPGAPEMVAFLDGPVVLAGLVEEERKLSGNRDEPGSVLIADRERNHGWWTYGRYRTKGQERGFRLIPLLEIKDEAYTVYFPVDIG